MVKIVAAVGVLILLSLGGYFMWKNKQDSIEVQQHEITKTILTPHNNSTKAAKNVEDIEKRVQEQIDKNN